MPHWTVDEPARLEFDEVFSGRPLQVSHEDGTLFDGVAGGVQAKTVSGTPEGRDVDGAVRFKSVSGDLTLAGGSLTLLEAGSDDAVRPHSTAGNVRSEFDSLRPATPYWSHTVSGNVGEGTGNVSVNSVSGAVTLLRRPEHRATPRTEAPRAEAGMESETR